MSENVTTQDTGTAAPTSAASATPAQATPSAPAAAPATPSATPAPATPGAPGEGWVPSYRLREAREAAERQANESWGTKEQQWRAELDRVNNQLRALVGVTPQNTNPEIDAVRDQFGRLYPGLAALEERAAQIQEMLEQSGGIQAQNEHYWQSYGRQTMDRLFDHATKSLGAPLTDQGKGQLHAAFVGYVQSSPERSARYQNDPSIVEDFWNEFTSSFIDPVRRTAASTVVNRTGAALPQDRGGSPAPVPGAPKPANIDERAEGAWARYQQLAKT